MDDGRLRVEVFECLLVPIYEALVTISVDIEVIVYAGERLRGQGYYQRGGAHGACTSWQHRIFSG